MNNPIELMKAFMKGSDNPQDLLKVMTANNHNPMIENVVKMANNGDSKGVEDFARNMFKEQGRDFDKEFGEFMKNFKKG